MFVSAPWQFYTIRLLLGAFEAGFFPGVILYLSYWFPSARRGRATGQFMFALPFAGVVGGPLSGWIMANMDGTSGLGGWQWCFIFEGLPTILLGIVCYFRLDDGPSCASWLSEREKAVIASDLQSDRLQSGSSKTGHGSFREAFSDPRVYLLGFIYFGLACGAYTFSFWLPTMIRRLGVTDIGQIGLLSLFPYAFAAAGMVLIPWSSDIRRERRWHLVIGLVLGGVALSASTLASGSLLGSLAILCVAGFFVIGPGSLFWTIPPTYLKPEAASVGIAVVSSIGILGGFLSPTLIGYISTETGSLSAGLYVISGVLIAGAVAVLIGMPARGLRVGPEQEVVASSRAT